MGLGPNYLTRVNVSLDGWDIDVLIAEGNDRLMEIHDSWTHYEDDEHLSPNSAKHGQQMTEQIWGWWWDLLKTLHKAKRELDEQIANR